MVSTFAVYILILLLLLLLSLLLLFQDRMLISMSDDERMFIYTYDIYPVSRKTGHHLLPSMGNNSQFSCAVLACRVFIACWWHYILHREQQSAALWHSLNSTKSALMHHTITVNEYSLSFIPCAVKNRELNKILWKLNLLHTRSPVFSVLSGS